MEDLDEKIEQRTYSYGGAVVYLGIAVVCGGRVVQQVASTIDALIERQTGSKKDLFESQNGKQAKWFR